MNLNIKQTQVGRENILEVECPACREWTRLDEPTATGKVPIKCKCGWKMDETVDVASRLQEGKYQAAAQDPKGPRCPVCGCQRFKPYGVRMPLAPGDPLPPGVIEIPGQPTIIEEVLFMSCVQCGICIRPSGEPNEHSNDPAPSLPTDGEPK